MLPLRIEAPAINADAAVTLKDALAEELVANDPWFHAAFAFSTSAVVVPIRDAR